MHMEKGVFDIGIKKRVEFDQVMRTFVCYSVFDNNKCTNRFYPQMVSNSPPKDERENPLSA